jgi:hypothetical protein
VSLKLKTTNKDQVTTSALWRIPHYRPKPGLVTNALWGWSSDPAKLPAVSAVLISGVPAKSDFGHLPVGMYGSVGD